MANDRGIEMDGIVPESLRDARFKVRLANGPEVLAHIRGEIRKHFIGILPEDRDVVELSAYDLTRGRVVFRYAQQ